MSVQINKSKGITQAVMLEKIFMQEDIAMTNFIFSGFGF